MPMQKSTTQPPLVNPEKSSTTVPGSSLMTLDEMEEIEERQMKALLEEILAEKEAG